jgi:hypothetical protein
LSRVGERQPIQLQQDIKKEFDQLHSELRATLHEPELTQSACVGYLIRHYRENSQRQQV